MSYPTTHLEDAQKLTADGIVELFEITLGDGSVLRLKLNDDVTWQGNSYEGIHIKISGTSRSSDDEKIRPKLTIANPDGVFSFYVGQGHLDAATIVRYRVLRTHIDTDQNIFRKETWKVRRPVVVNKTVIVLELRNQLDGQFFLVPYRMYIPPEFKQVSLS